MINLKKTFTALALAAGAMVASAPASAALSLTFTPASSHINVGDSVFIDVSITGLGAEILSGYDLNFLFNSSVLTTSSVTAFPVLGASLGLNQVVSAGDIALDDSSLEDDATLLASQADDLLLFTFLMTGVADGVTSFALGADADFERNVLGLNAESLNVNVGSACIAVGTGSCDNRVPEPASFGLAGLALLAAGVAGRARRRSHAKI
jgi:MYXO-CTERM domain-containing protein